MGASLFAWTRSPSCRPCERISHRAALYPQRRSVASSTPRWQQAAPAAAQKPAARTPEPQAVTPKVNNPDHALSPNNTTELHSLTEGLTDAAPQLDENERQVDWARSFHGLSSTPFTTEQSAVLQQELTADDIEIKPDGILYLPEIKYRRILNKAFGPGGWGLAPRGETIVTGKLVTREYGLVAGGRYALQKRQHSLTMSSCLLLFSVASYPSPAANNNTSTPTASRPQPKAASPTRSCAAVKTWESRASFGTRDSFAAS